MRKENIKIVSLVAAFIISVILGFIIIGNIPVKVNSGEVYDNKQHLYWKNVPCKVLDLSSDITYNMHVVNEEYGIERVFRFWGKEAEQYKDFQPGDTIWCIMYSWVNEGSGEVESRILSLNNIE